MISDYVVAYVMLFAVLNFPALDVLRFASAVWRARQP